MKADEPGLSRRCVLAAGGLGLAGVAGFGLAGCDGPAVAPAPPAGGPPQRGGILRMAFADSADTLDPQGSMSYVAAQLTALVYDTLTRLDAQGRAIPWLATRWWPEDEGRDWVFELREGVRFHHGRPFTAADVVATVNRIEDRTLALSGAGTFGPVERVRAEGERHVRFTYRQPFGEAPLTAAEGRAAILPADLVGQMRNRPCGTGPFRFVDFQPGSRLSVTRNEDYWLPGRPYLDGVEILAIREPVAQQGALQAGEIHLLTMISPEAALSLRRDPQLQVHSVSHGNYHAVTLQANRAPFDRPPVREAFRYLIDRPQLLASALLGQGRIGNDIPLAPGEPLYPPLNLHGRDIARAKALLRQGGIDGPLRLDLWTSSERPPAPKLALALAQGAALAGIELRVRDVPYTEYVARVARKEALYTTYQSGSPSLYQSVYRSYHSQASMNYGRTEAFSGADAQLDAMIAAPSAELRQRLATELLGRLSLHGEKLVPYFPNYLAAVRRSVRGFTPPAYQAIDFRGIGF